MNWDRMKLLLALRRTGSLERAGAALQISRATAHRHLQELETELGGRVFSRDGGNYTLTPLGEALEARAGRVEQIFEDIQRTAAAADRAATGPLMLTAPFSFGLFQLPKLLAEAREREPELDIRLQLDSRCVALEKREADLAIRVQAAPAPELFGRKLGTLPWGFYGAEPGRETPSTLAHHPLIGPCGDLAEHPSYQWLERHHHPAIRFRCSDPIGMAAMARDGLGLSLLPADVGTGLHLRCLVPDLEWNPTWLLCHRDLREVRRIRTAMSLIGDRLSATLDQLRAASLEA